MTDAGALPPIASVDAAARALYRRARLSRPEFADLAIAVRALHTVLKHLRAEADDPDSLLSSRQHDGLYATQLAPVVRACDLTLGQLGSLLDKYGVDGDVAPNNAAPALEGPDRAVVAMIRANLAAHRTGIDTFLDAIQLHHASPTGAPDLHHADGRQLDAIKDKVDAVAARLSRRRRSAVNSENEEDMWQQFWAELVSEGFSSEVLQKNKEVLRAYIRELDSHGLMDNGSPPSVRGLLLHGAQPPGISALPAGGRLSRDDDSSSPKEVVSNIDNQKFSPLVKSERRQPELGPSYSPSQDEDGPGPWAMQQTERRRHDNLAPPLPLQAFTSGPGYDRHSSDSESDLAPDKQAALISTWDLVAFDNRQAESLAARLGSMHLPPSLQPTVPLLNHSISPGFSSDNSRHLPQPPYPTSLAPATSQTLSSSPQTQALLSVSPRYVPPLPPYLPPAPGHATMSPPPAYAASPVAASAPVYPTGAVPPRYSKLAPDSRGKVIPLDAAWTRIKRALVSPEVLERAGVRYEARPDFVAILGVLSREDIAEFAKTSAQVRAARGRGRDAGDNEKQQRGLKARADGNGPLDPESESGTETLWDESDTSDEETPAKRYLPRSHRSGADAREAQDAARAKKGTKVYPFIVSPPSSDKPSPASTVPAKPILKNQNTHRVRFDADGPREVSSASEDTAPRSPRWRDDERSRDRHRHSRSSQREDKHTRRWDRDRDSKYYGQERDGERDRAREGEGHQHGHRRHRATDRERQRDRERARDGVRDRDKDRDASVERREDRRIRKNVWGETLGAVGIGGAAASLLSVLSEAASGL